MYVQRLKVYKVPRSYYVKKMNRQKYQDNSWFRCVELPTHAWTIALISVSISHIIKFMFSMSGERGSWLFLPGIMRPIVLQTFGLHILFLHSWLQLSINLIKDKMIVLILWSVWLHNQQQYNVACQLLAMAEVCNDAFSMIVRYIFVDRHVEILEIPLLRNSRTQHENLAIATIRMACETKQIAIY